MSNIIKTGQVVYVEPNSVPDFTTYDSDNLGRVYKSVNLEDMSIVVGLEVEVKGRTYMSKVGGNENNILLNWQSTNDGETISFMQGTKIPTADGGYVRSLTTNYTDCHLFDIENDGTAEMFGIKFIDISYNNFMIPEVTIQFVDVRGVALFAQEEMRHTLKDDNGVEGKIDNSIEGSFFKCFFTFPYPKFTLKVKGFYGEMVSYELSCADFRAAFDSHTGNFNVTARFVGYRFSFLTDVMVNGLVAAPYSEYLGKKYWDDNIGNGRFYVRRRDKTPVSMQTLSAICQKFKDLKETVENRIEQEGPINLAESEEEKTILTKYDLADVQGVYNELRKELDEIVKTVNSEGSSSHNGDIAITTSDTKSYAFIVDSDNENLNDLVEKFKDLNDRIAEKAGNGVDVLKGKFIALVKYSNYGDIANANHLVRADIVRDKSLCDRINNIAEAPVEKSDFTYYYDAWEDNLDSFVYIYEDNGLYDILRENQQISSSEERAVAKIKEDIAQREYVKEFNKVFEFEPTVENITRIIMAHVETFIYMISQCAQNIINSGTKRTADNLNIKWENFPDAYQNGATPPTGDTIIAPFPKVTNTNEENGVKKTEGEWIGKLLTGDQAEEIKLVEGLLNGITQVSNELNRSTYSPGSGEEMAIKNPLKYPLTYFDMFMRDNDKPFGNVNTSDINDIFANVCIRAFSVMATQGRNNVDSMAYGMVDAENFLNCFKGKKDLGILSRMIGSITGEKVVKYLSNGKDKLDGSKKNNPWYRFGSLITDTGSETYILKPGYLGKKHAIFPIRNWTFQNIAKDAVQNEDNPRAGLKTSYLKNYINSSAFGDSTWDYATNTPVIAYREAPIQYFKVLYRQAASSSYESDKQVAAKAFASSNGFEFDYNEWVAPYDSWEAFFDESGRRVDYKEAISYDADGKVTSASKYALDLKNVFMDESFYKTSQFETYSNYSKALKFIESVFGNAPQTIKTSFRAFDKTIPRSVYFGKFAILMDGWTFFTTKRDFGIRPTFKGFYKSYFLSWADKIYATIEKAYKLDLKTGSSIAKIQREVKALAVKTDKAISEVFKRNLNPEGYNKFLTLYRVKYDDGIYLETRPCSEMSEIIKDLMMIVGVCATSQFNVPEDRLSSAIDITLKKGQLEGYFDGFINTLKNNLSDSSDNVSVDVSVGESSDPDDLKVGVYDYIKLLYDKWLASGAQDEFYKLEELFEGGNPTFQFIDSTYNKIGNTMYLNLSRLVDKVVQSQTKNGYALLSLLSDLYAENKFLFLCIQNFLDFSDAGMMEKMFKPISYLDYHEPSNHPNFIVLMPYEPSTKLDVEGADYPDDGFYLNIEETWPEMIKSKPADSYPIPAFGVSYGQQYQNYFKNVEVDMSAPMSTEQSIRAKFMIAGAGTGDENNGPTHITAGQDLYSIYSNNSYTCNVTMMGCAWVQPMMYFVLQNVPMFRGSYMIVKVNHQIQPGKMTTTFKGVRMANTATRSVKQFILSNVADSVANGLGVSVATTNRAASYANIENDCQYAYYSPTGGFIDLPSNADAQAYCYATYQALMESGLSDAQAKGICANIKEESGFNPYVITIDGGSGHHGVGGGLAGFYYHGQARGLFNFVYGPAGQDKLKELNAKVEPYWRANPVPCSTANKNKMAQDGLKYEISFVDQVRYICTMANGTYSGIKNQTTATNAALWWLQNYERPAGQYRNVDRWGKNGKWVETSIAAGIKTYTGTTSSSSEEKKSTAEIASGLTQSLSTSLRTNTYYSQTTVSMVDKGGDYYEYKATGKDATNALFDCLLTSYRRWFDDIKWYVGSTQATQDAISVRIHITRAPAMSQNVTMYCSDTHGERVLTIDRKGILNESLRKILIKYFKSKNITTPEGAKKVFRSCVPMNNADVTETFELEGIKSIVDCGSVMGQSSNSTNFC